MGTLGFSGIRMGYWDQCNLSVQQSSLCQCKLLSFDSPAQAVFLLPAGTVELMWE